MGDLLYIAIVFSIYAIIILIIAFIGKYITRNLSDYILAGRKLSGPITALGAGASDMSSWLTMALPGFIYLYGLSMIWMPIALIIGAWCNWIFIAKRLRIYTEITNEALTLPSYLYHRFHDHKKFLRTVTSLASVIFFTCYAAAGFMSGAILLQIIFGLDYFSGLLIISTAIIIYTSIGGFLALNWIDFFQGTLMFVALLVVPIVTAKHLGGLEIATLVIKKHFPQHLEIFNNTNALGLISCLAWGLGYFGQPHINIRFMAIRSVKELPIARRICMTWMILSLLGAIGTGFFGAAFYGQEILSQPETVFINLSRKLFNPWMTGILLSAVLASIMNTVSAQILMTTSIIVEDIVHATWKRSFSDQKYLLLSKIIMVVISIIAVKIATNPKTILHAVGFAWSGLGAAFGPTILCSLYWRKMNLPSAISGVVVGMLAVISIQLFLNHPDLLPGFVILPAFLLSTATIFIVGNVTKNPSKQIIEQFDIMILKNKS
jgi:sodium/proline symporter